MRKKKLFLCSEFFEVARHIFKIYLTDSSFKVLFIHTASETHKKEARTWAVNDRQAFVDGGFDVTDFSITGKSKIEIAEAFDKTDIIFSTGGNTYHYLDQIQQTDSADLYRKAILKDGKIYIGGSAGSIVTSPDISSRFNRRKTPNMPVLKSTQSLGLVDFIIFPHWGRVDFKESYLESQMPFAYREDALSRIILLTDNQYVRVEGDMYQIVDIRQDS